MSLDDLIRNNKKKFGVHGGRGSDPGPTRCFNNRGAQKEHVDSLPGLEIVSGFSIGLDKVDLGYDEEKGFKLFLGLIAIVVVMRILKAPIGYRARVFESEGSDVGRGVKEKQASNTTTLSDDTMNDDTPVGVSSVVKEGVTPSVVDMTVEMEKLSPLDDTTILGSFPLLSMSVTTTAGNAPGKSSYANVIGKSSGKKLNIRTLFTPRGNGIDVVILVKLDAMLENGPWFIRNNPLILKKWHSNENLLKEDVSIVPVWVKLHGVPVTAFSEDGLSVIVSKLGTPLMFDSYTSDMCMQSWGRSSYARVMVELRADVELKDNIVVVMPKITREVHYTCNVRVEYEWKPPRCSSYKVFGHVHEECIKNTGAGEKKTVKKPSQTSRGVSVGPKMGFKPQKEYRPVIKKPNASSSGNKKKGMEPTIEASNSNPFDVLNSVDNDGELGTNGRTNNLVNNEATSSG
ncbi:zinc finger, CCHC-type containing protein [Tanacetum coccineum]